MTRPTPMPAHHTAVLVAALLLASSLLPVTGAEARRGKGAAGAVPRRTPAPAVDAEPTRGFSFTFDDERGRRRTVRCELDADAVDADRATSLGFPDDDAIEAQQAAVRRYARGVDDVEVEVRARGRGVSIQVTGRDRKAMRAALKGAGEAAEAGLDGFLDEIGWTRDGRKLRPDHPRLARDYTDELRPLARALAEGLDLDDTGDQRAFAARALHLVQSLPYEKRKGGGDKGYRRPLAVLDRERGDCDSKTVLYLAIVRGALPRLPAAVVYIRDHTFAAVGVPVERGDVTVRSDGRTLVIAEPVGPAREALGDGGRKSVARARAGTARVEAVPLGRPSLPGR